MKMFYYEWEDETLSVVVAQNKKEALMKMFYYEWEDETLSVVVAQNKKEAFLILDEIGDADPEKIKRISSNEYIIAQGVGFVQFKISI